MQLVELGDRDGNYFMRNLPVVLENEFGTSKSRKIKFSYNKFWYVGKVKKLKSDATKN